MGISCQPLFYCLPEMLKPSRKEGLLCQLINRSPLASFSSTASFNQKQARNSSIQGASMLADSLFTVHAITDRKYRSIKFTLKGPEGSAQLLLQAVRLLESLCKQIARQTEAEARQIRTAARLQEWERKQCCVRKAYRRLRADGLKHLEAVRCVAVLPEFSFLREVHHWGFSDFHHCIGPAFNYKPLLTVPNPKRRSRSAGGVVNSVD